MNLLVVEDNPRDMQELLNLLHGWEEQNQPLGIRAESCITADTMQAFQGYDAVLLDIETPGIDGMAFARRLRACNSRIDIIFVTCHTDLVMDGFSLIVSIYHFPHQQALGSENVRIALLRLHNTAFQVFRQRH